MVRTREFNENYGYSDATRLATSESLMMAVIFTCVEIKFEQKLPKLSANIAPVEGFAFS